MKKKIDSELTSRRDFLNRAIKLGSVGIAGLGISAMYSSCASFDDFLIDDRFSYKKEVIIIGGGISGLYLAHQLRKSKTEFRLFDGAKRFGGRILSDGEIDLGASFLSTQDKSIASLLKELNLEKTYLDKNNYYINQGTEKITQALLDKTLGLIPYRNFRLRWKLVAIEKSKSIFQLTFDTPSGQKKIDGKKIAFAIPPNQWEKINGLFDLPEMRWAKEWIKTLKTESAIKMAFYAPNYKGKKLVTFTDDEYRFTQIYKKNKKSAHVEIETRFLNGNEPSSDYLYETIKKKLQFNVSIQKNPPSHYFDWGNYEMIKGVSFKNFIALPKAANPHFQLIGDFTASQAPHTLEGALVSVESIFSELI